MKFSWKNALEPVLFFAALLILWEILVEVIKVPTFILPPPRDLWIAFWKKLPILGNHSFITFIEAFGGFVLSLVLGVGFAIAGVPGAMLLGMLTFFLSVVPMGPPLVWIPAVIWLFSQGRTGMGIFMLIWGIGVSSIDNVVKPWLISQGSAMPFVLIFFGVLGGALAFGFIGVFLGPTLLAVAFRLIEEWTATRANGSEGSAVDAKN